MQEEKAIYIRLADGEEWAIPLRVVAEDRAKYYAEKDKETTFEEEFKFCMEDSYEGIDWFQNNMSCKDFKEHFVLIKEARKREFWERIEKAVNEGDNCFKADLRRICVGGNN